MDRRTALSLTAAGAASLAASVAELEAVTWEMERRGMVAPDFGGWQCRTRPEFDWTSPHFGYMQDHLDRVTAGELRRVLFQVSVRHGKTENNTIGYGAYRICLEPSTRILLGTYSEKQAHKLSRQIRRIVTENGVTLTKEADGEWETAEGGGLRAVGAGSGVASVNADLIIIDDPIGSRADAESQAHRDGTWDWITSDILARCEPHTGVLFSMPRWHVDDPAGRMQERQAGRWTVVDLPGLAEEGDPLGREPGDLLWPEYRPRSWMQDMEAELGPYGFASLVQGRPTPRGGGMFERGWFDIIDDVPTGGHDIFRVRYWDKAGTEGDGAYTVGLLMGVRVPDGLVWIEDVKRGRWAAGDREAEIRSTAENDALRYAVQGEPNRLAVLYMVEQEPGSGGKDSAEATRRNLAGYRVETETATGDKFVRADPLAGGAKSGSVKLIRGPWNEAFLNEMEHAGPGAKYLDQMDAGSGAYNRLMKMFDTRLQMAGVSLGVPDEPDWTPGWRVE